MDFTEKMKELIAKGASIDEIASSFGLDVNVLPPEWILFFSNSMMLTCSMMTQLESFNTKMEGAEVLAHLTLYPIGGNVRVL